MVVVISPLIALMEDQVQALERFGVKAAFLNSSQDPAAQWATQLAAVEGRLDLLYVAPERANSAAFQELVSQLKVSLFAVDEAKERSGHKCHKQFGK